MFIEKDHVEQRKHSAKHEEYLKRKTAGTFFTRREMVKAGMLTVAVCVWIWISVYAGERAIQQQNIAEVILRFHVLANSNSEEDQKVKYQVRDAVLAWMESNIKTSEQKYEMQKLLEDHLSEIEKAANNILKAAGMDYCAAAEVTRCYFPDRTYGECTFAAGWYDALRIELGEAKGQNWWCVLYPQLCFQDCLHAVVEEEQLQKLEEVLTVEEYESLLVQPQKWKLAFRWF